MKTISLQIFCEFGLKFLKTSGTRNIVARPKNVMKTPKTFAPFKSQTFSVLACSRFPLPRFFPRMTPVAVHIPPNATKKRFAIAKLADIPETTSAPPLPL